MVPLRAFVNHLGPTCAGVPRRTCDLVGGYQEVNVRGLYVCSLSSSAKAQKLYKSRLKVRETSVVWQHCHDRRRAAHLHRFASGAQLLSVSESRFRFLFFNCTSTRTNRLGNAFFILTHKRQTKGSREKRLFGRHERGNVWPTDTGYIFGVFFGGGHIPHCGIEGCLR